MDPDTFRSDIEVDVYWRRRMAALVGVLVVVALVAWACSATSGPDDTSPKDASATRPAASASAPVVLPSPTAASGPAGSPSPAPTPVPHAVKAASRVKRPGDACEAPQLVLNMEGRGTVYPAGARPRFIVTLVNTGKVMCTADVGPRTMEVRITSGDDRVWSSADCVSGEVDDIRRLDRGIPYVRELVWDRRRSSADCRTEGVPARPGTYVAVVRLPGVSSSKTVFHLR
ncbi:hypothetical protein FHS43_003820 [Streptosporangium becharense]|uniref:MucR family transcriptional regulator n=1 Tax=Streptosporangium becharense TaxID=1816182 RepID=A0A7W9MHM7_9ACTN|nr:hypothetical protein [Streptosporangium becharense]MBB2912537.1 hypothetical protein [Streptosporangium becharense]MBB5820633.1 hypothetical protein [Streptosporangium becharense]